MTTTTRTRVAALPTDQLVELDLDQTPLHDPATGNPIRGIWMLARRTIHRGSNGCTIHELTLHRWNENPTSVTVCTAYTTGGRHLATVHDVPETRR
jgi:hypothetical protein